MQKSIIGLALSLILTGGAWAENTTRVAGYTIHHNALTADNLAPQIASAYGIQRSKNRGLLNITVIKDEPGTTGTPVKAHIKATATDLRGQSRQVAMREILDGEAIYYLGVLRVLDQETLHFDLEVKPSGSGKSFSTQISQQFFTE